jgi:hypothetical protein
MNFMAQNIEEILGTAITEYTPNAIKFRGFGSPGDIMLNYQQDANVVKLF